MAAIETGGAGAAIPPRSNRKAPRLVSAVATEISEEWETNRTYLTMEPE